MEVGKKGVLRPIPLHGAYTDFVLRSSLNMLRREAFTCCAGGYFVGYPDTVQRTEFERNSANLSTGNLTDFSTRTTWTADSRFRDTVPLVANYHRPWQTEKDLKSPEFKKLYSENSNYLGLCSVPAKIPLVSQTENRFQNVLALYCSNSRENLTPFNSLEQPSASVDGRCLWRPFCEDKEKLSFDLNEEESMQRNNVLFTPGSCCDHPAMFDCLSPANHNYDFLQKKVKRIKCPFCQVACLNNGQMIGHLRVHTGEKPFQCDHPSCGKRFARNEELTRHKRIHSGERPHECETCHKRFGRKDHLTKHRKTHQKASERRIYVCQVPECGHRYTRSDALTRHQWTVHNIRWKPSSQTHPIRKAIDNRSSKPLI